MKLNGWDHALKVTATGEGLVGHARAILLRKAADVTGLTSLVSGALEEKGKSPLLDRGTVLVLLTEPARVARTVAGYRGKSGPGAFRTSAAGSAPSAVPGEPGALRRGRDGRDVRLQDHHTVREGHRLPLRPGL